MILTDPSLRHTRVVVVTGRSDFPAESEALLRQAHGFFRKPFSPLALADHIRSLMSDAPPHGDLP
jgi:FixJ family two-component response regulator